MNKQCDPIAVRRDLRKLCDVTVVAAKHGVSDKTVYRHANGMNLKLLREIGGDKDKELKIVRAMKNAAGINNEQIAKILGVSAQYISQILNEL